jgi:hypothetical protein
MTKQYTLGVFRVLSIENEVMLDVGSCNLFLRELLTQVLGSVIPEVTTKCVMRPDAETRFIYI